MTEAALPIGRAFQRLVEVTGESSDTLTAHLGAAHHVGVVWFLFAGVGVMSGSLRGLCWRWILRMAPRSSEQRGQPSAPPSARGFMRSSSSCATWKSLDDSAPSKDLVGAIEQGARGGRSMNTSGAVAEHDGHRAASLVLLVTRESERSVSARGHDPETFGERPRARDE